MDKDTALAILLVGVASGIFTSFCDSWFTVSSAFFHEQTAKETNIRRIRWGEVIGSVIVIGMGVAASWKSDNKFAFWAAVAVCAVFVGGYEYMIAHPSKETQEVSA